MTCARTLATSLFLLLALAPFARADGISLSTFSVTPNTIYPASSGALATTTTITLAFSQRVHASIAIEDASGTPVRMLYTSASVMTPSPKVWDGKDDSGAVVAPGIYTIVIAASTSTLTFADTSHTVTVALSASTTERAPAFALQSYSLPLALGWNLLSVPVAPADARAASVFASSSVDAVWSYDPGDPSADASGWLVYDSAHPELSTLTAIAPGAGYFVHASSTGVLNISGTLFAPDAVPPSRTLIGGWNLVGSYATSSEYIDSAFATIGWAGLEYLALWKLDPVSKSFVLPSMVEPGDAFWIFLDAPHTYAPADL
jgi:hypothetical protein